jgi:hypothetical protein
MSLLSADDGPAHARETAVVVLQECPTGRKAQATWEA